MEEKFKKYRMATKAYHKLGEISSSIPDLCRVYNEDEDNFYGMWVTGLGFFNVRFPKETTRKLTEEEKEHYIGKMLSINNNLPHYQFKKEDFEESKEND